MSLRQSPRLLIAGKFAKDTTIPPPPWRKVREQAHLQKFKEFNLREFPWVVSQYGLSGASGGWQWGDPKQMHAQRLIRESQHEPAPPLRRIPHPDLPHESRRMAVPPAAKAVLASFLRGRGGGYGVSPHHINIPTTVQSEVPALDTAKKDEPRTARARWAQYRKIFVSVPVEDLQLSPQARRRLEGMVPEDIHEGVLRIGCDNYEDYWDNYEFVVTKILQLVAEARKADIHPSYWPMEQYKVHEKSGYERAVESVENWHAMQAESISLGERYCKLKNEGVESVTGFNLYDTKAYRTLNEEKAKIRRVEVQVKGESEGYTVGKLYAAMSQVHSTDIEEADELDSTEGVLTEEGDQPTDTPHEVKKPRAAEEEDYEDLLKDFVNPDEQ
eukprot:Sspe_Gene.96770::Locus_69943_Transcript_1_1_Confidence_1.000_Length_1349::g.96770::m.96770